MTEITPNERRILRGWKSENGEFYVGEFSSGYKCDESIKKLAEHLNNICRVYNIEPTNGWGNTVREEKTDISGWWPERSIRREFFTPKIKLVSFGKYFVDKAYNALTIEGGDSNETSSGDTMLRGADRMVLFSHQGQWWDEADSDRGFHVRVDLRTREIPETDVPGQYFHTGP